MNLPIKKLVLLYALMPVLLVSMMIGTQLIPNSWIRDNVNKSKEIINVESIYHDAYHVPQVHWLAGSDGYTDKIYLEQQIADRSHGVAYGAMMPSYDRYWHGYSIFLRPLLIFFDMSYVRQILVLSFMLLFALLFHLVVKHIGLAVGICMALAFALVNPPVIMISLQYSNMFLLTLVASIVLMYALSKKRPTQEIVLLFAIFGCLTGFFDLMTTPSIVLGVPLLLFVAHSLRHDIRKNLIKNIVLLSVVWGLGFVLMWAAKWVIGSLILHRNIFLEAQKKVGYWSSDYSAIESRKVTVLYVIEQWVKRLVLYWPVIISLILGGMIGVGRFFRKRKFVTGRFLTDIIALLIPTCIPVAWVFVATRHSLNHQWFSYRHLVVSLFGAFLIIWYLNSNLAYKTIPSLVAAIPKKGKHQTSKSRQSRPRKAHA